MMNIDTLKQIRADLINLQEKMEGGAKKSDITDIFRDSIAPLKDLDLTALSDKEWTHLVDVRKQIDDVVKTMGDDVPEEILTERNEFIFRIQKTASGSMATLPEEVQFMILSYLTPEESGAVQLVDTKRKELSDVPPRDFIYFSEALEYPSFRQFLRNLLEGKEVEFPGSGGKKVRLVGQE